MNRFRGPFSCSTASRLSLFHDSVAAADIRTHSTSAAHPKLTSHSSSKPFLPSRPPPPSPNVAIFWDLQTTKPPSTLPAYEAAVRLRLAASRFGPVRHSVAFCPPTLPARRVPPENGRSFPTEPSVCGVCGRRFFDRPKLLAHFKELHQREHAKRLRRLESAKGSRRVNLAASMAAKMDKYRKAADSLFAAGSSDATNYGGSIIVPPRGMAVFELADELRRAGLRVQRIPPGLPWEVSSRALRDHVGEVVDRGAAGCLMLVSDDTELVGVVRDARACGIKTVVVGDDDARQGGHGDGGVLRRVADAGFTWREVLSGKARDETPKVTGRWKDKELLSRLEWKYRAEDEHHDDEDEDVSGEGNKIGVVLNQDKVFQYTAESDDSNSSSIYASVWKTDDGRPWWDLGNSTDFERK